MPKNLVRFSTAPDPAAPELSCPTCGRSLIYRQTVFGGVSPQERWDYFECRTCGLFEYRHRTRRLRSTDLLALASSH